MGLCGWFIFCILAALSLVMCVIWSGEPLFAISCHHYGSRKPDEPGQIQFGTAEADAREIEASAQVVEMHDPTNVDSISVPPIPSANDFPDDPDALVDSVYARNDIMGDKLQGAAANATETPSTATLAQAAQRIEDGVTAAASPAPPHFDPVSLDVLPQKYWEPVYPGCAPVFTDKRCDYFYPTPRLWVTDLDQLRYARSLEQGRENMIEPMKARQALAQVLSIGVRTRRDVYTQASPANDIASQNKCAQLKTRSPAYVWL